MANEGEAAAMSDFILLNKDPLSTDKLEVHKLPSAVAALWLIDSHEGAGVSPSGRP